MAIFTMPVVTEIDEPTSSKEVYRIEEPSELLNLWQQASEKFERSISQKGRSKEDVNQLSQPDIESWLLNFKESRHPDTKFRKFCKTISRHLHTIQTSISFIKFGSSIASSVLVAASPASTVVDGFAFLFGSVVKVSEDFDKIESFFEKMAKTFGHLQSLNGRLDLAGMQPLKKFIVEIFISSLEICRIGFSQTEKRFKTWLQKMRGDDELDAAFKNMQDAEEEFIKAIQITTLALGATTVDVATHIKTDLGEAKIQRILDWLSSDSSTINPYNDYKELKRQLQQVRYSTEAGKWLLDSEQFKNWRDRDCRMLWYTGAPGAGKSVIASIIIQNLLDLSSQTSDPSKKPAVGYVFLSYKRKPDVGILLGSIVRQVVFTCNGQKEIEKKFDKCPDKEIKLDKEELIELLSSLVKGRCLYIVVDAMDECPRELRKPFLDSLQSIKSENAVIKILVTSRLMEQLAEFQKSFMKSEIIPNNQDIDEYIKHIIKENYTKLGKHSKDIHRIVSKKSKDMFIIVRLHMDALADVQVEGDVLATLSKLPESLDEAYDSTFERIQAKPSYSRKIGISVIAWVSYAIDPLSIQEMRHALAAMKLNGNGSIEEFMMDENEIITYCCGLIVIDLDHDVRFVHRSTQEYFELRKTAKFTNFEYQMALACTKYLIFCGTKYVEDSGMQTALEEQSHQRKNAKRTISATRKKFPFAVYAGKYLHVHNHQVRHLPEGTDSSEVLSSLIQQLVNDLSSRKFYSYLLYSLEAYYSKSDILDDHNEFEVSNLTTVLDILHMAAFLGNNELVKEATKSHDINGLDCYGQSALVVAFKNNLDDIAEILLDYGSTVNLLDRKGHVLLLYAAEKKYFKAVEKIIGNVPNDRPHGFLKLLGLVMMLVYDLLLLLVERLVPGAHNRMELGKPEMKDDVKLLDDETLVDYRMLLSFAYHGQWENIESLLGMNAIDLNLIKLEDSPPQELYSYSGYRLSTSYRQDVYKWDSDMQSSTDDHKSVEDSEQRSIYGNDEDKIFEGDSDIDDNKSLSTEERDIHPGSEKFNISGAWFESDKDEDSYTDESRGDAPLNQDNSDVMEDHCVLDGKSDSDNIIDSNKTNDASARIEKIQALFIKTAYFLAMERSHCHSMKILIENAIAIDPSNINLRNYQGQSLLHRATATNNEEIVKAVLEKKPEVNIRDYNGRTALMAYADPKRKDVLKILLDHGANIDLTHDKNNHELYEAAVFGAIKVVQYYLTNKVNASISNIYGWTPLHGAAANGHVEVVQALLSAKANPSSISDTGRTPLDFVKSGDTHYDGTLTQGSRRHYSHVEHEQKKLDQVEKDKRKDEIDEILTTCKAKTSNELRKEIGDDLFYYGPGGKYTHPGCWGNDWAEDIRRVQGDSK